MSKSRVETQVSHKPYIYVSDWYNYRIVRFKDMSGAGWEEIGPIQDWGIIDGPTCFRIDGEGKFLIVDRGRSTILRLDYFSSDSSFETFQSHVLYRPQRLAFDSKGRIYITGGYAHNVVRIDDISDTNPVELPLDGHPMGIYIDKDDRLYVTLYWQDRIVRMDDMTGRNMVSFGVHGSGRNQLHYPADVMLDEDERIYICDNFNHRIIRMDDMTGKGWKELDMRFQDILGAPKGLVIKDNFFYSLCYHSLVRTNNMDGENPVVFGTIGSEKFYFRHPMDIYIG